jgi:DNA ligase (NAD+)
MRAADFRTLNARLEREGQPAFANARNAAAGSLRQLDPGITGSRPVHVIFYDILRLEGAPGPATAHEALRVLTQWGLRTSPHARVVSGVPAIVRYHRDMARRRETLEYEIDGVVIKVDDLAARRQLLSTARHPRWALAWKFAPRAQETVIQRIDVQVGRTGVLTPVAVLRPVSLGGVTVSRATLHNREEIARKDLRAGDAVRVVRAGDVIPEIVERVPRGRARRGRPFAMPRRCPRCRTHVVRDGAIDRCPNGLSCPAQLERAIQHFASRHAMDIRGLGPATVRALVAAGLVRSVADLFGLTACDLLALERFADQSASSLLQGIARARRVSLWRFLHALGIPGVGAQTARDLSAHVGRLDALLAADEARLMEVPGVGASLAHDIAAFFRRPVNRRIVARCRRHGVQPASSSAMRRGPLAGKTVVFTGGLETMTREEAEERARALGARTAGSVTARTDIVVAGHAPGAKRDRARALGIRIFDEARFRRLLGA